MVCPPSQDLVSPSLPFSPIEPIVSHCLLTRVPVLDGASAFPTCPPSRSLISHCLPFSPQMVCPPSQRLVSELSPIVPTCVPVLDGPPSRKSCSSLSPIVSLPRYVCLCWMVCPPSRGLVSPFLPTSLPVLDGASALDSVSAFPRSCLPLSACVGWCVRLPKVLFPLVSHFLLVSLCWMVSPPSRRIVSPCLPLSPHMCACVRWFVHLPEVLSPLFFHCLHCPRNCLPLSPFLSPRFPLSPVVCHCFPLSPHMCTCAGWCERLPRSCLPPLSPIVCPHWCLCWMVSPPWIISAFKRPCPPLSPHTCACVGCRARLPEVLSPFVSHCLPTCVPVLDGASTFPSSCLPLSPTVSQCLPLSPIVSLLVSCVGWCVRLPEVLSPLSPSLSPSLSSFLSPSLSPNLFFFLFPFVVGCLIFYFFTQCTVRGRLS